MTPKNGTGKPIALPVQPDTIPTELRDRPQWVVWRYELVKGKWTKPPSNARNGKHASSTNPKTWAPFAETLAVYLKGGWDGLGYVPLRDDPFVFGDPDKCRDPQTGELKPWVEEVLADLGDSYVEWSPSDMGLRFAVRASRPKGGKEATMPDGGKLEIFEPGKQYVTFTGHVLPLSPLTIPEQQAGLDRVYRRYILKETVAAAEDSFPDLDQFGPTYRPQGRSPAWDKAPELRSDEEVWSVAGEARNGAKFRALWAGDTSLHGGDHSRADLALCNILAHWCGKDRDRVDRLFRRSGLMRPKWDEPHRHDKATYGGMTLDKVCGGQTPGPLPGRNGKVSHQIPAAEGPISAPELLALELLPPVCVVDGLLPEGLSVIAGKPKLGKSWFALEIALAVSTGGTALGKISVTAAPVLYLALEDTRRRLKKRLARLLGNAPAPPTLHFDTTWKRQDDGGLTDIEKWLVSHPGTRLIIIDTWPKFRPRKKHGGEDYQQDYDHAVAVKTLADRHKVAVLLVAHCRKIAAEDPLDAVTGTLGLAGACDAVLVLRRERGQHDAALFVSGRDIEEEDYALQWEPTCCLWTLLGPAEKHRLSVQRMAVNELFWHTKVLTIKEVAERLSVKYDTAKHLLSRMFAEGLLLNQNGKYALRESPVSLPSPVSSVSPVSPLNDDEEEGDKGIRGYGDTGDTSCVGCPSDGHGDAWEG